MSGQKIHRVLVIGTGSIGERHIRCFAATGRARCAVVEPREALRMAVTRKYDVVDHYADLDAALTGRFNAAVIATPATMHVAMAERLLNAGMAVLIEKPLALSLDRLETLARRASTAKAAVGYVYRAHPALGAMHDLLSSGRFGKPLQVVAVCGQHFPTFRPAYRQTYYANHASGGGAIQDVLTHVLNAAEWLVGPITQVVADADHVKLDGVDVEDTVHLLARHGQVMGSYSLNQHQAPNEVTLTVIAEGGTARWELHHDRLSTMSNPGEPWEVQHFGPIERDAMFVRQANAFLDHVEGQSPPLCSVAEGVQAVRVNLAALASVASRQWHTV